MRVFAADDNLLPSADIRTINIPAQEEVEDEEDFEALDEQLPISELDIEEEQVQEEEDVESIFTLDLADSVPNRLSPSISTDEPLWELLEEDNALEEIASDDAAEEEEQANSPEPEVNAEALEESLDESNDYLEEELEELPLESPAPEPEQAVAPPSAPREEDAQIRSRMTAINFDDDILTDNSDPRSFTRFSAEEIEGVSGAETPLELDWQETSGGGRSAA